MNLLNLTGLVATNRGLATLMLSREDLVKSIRGKGILWRKKSERYEMSGGKVLV